MRRLLFSLLSVILMASTSVYPQRFTFSSVCSTGQTLYYSVIDGDNHYVAVTAPNGWGTDAYTGYTMPTGNVLVPTTVTYNNQSYTVKQIEGDAFWGCSGLTAVSIPTSVEYIGGGAFANCTSLSVVNLGNNLKQIEGYILENTAWWNNQPDGMTYLGNWAYRWKGEMPANTTITLATGTKGVCNYCCEWQSNVVAINFPSSLKYIGVFAFTGTPSRR